MFGTYLAGWANLEEPDLIQYYGFFVSKKLEVSFKIVAILKCTKGNKEKRSGQVCCCRSAVHSGLKKIYCKSCPCER